MIFSGIQPTGIPHLGNYLGAISQWTKLQAEAAHDDKLYFSIVDLHSLTSRSQSPDERLLARRQTLAVLLAAGLDPKRCAIFYQSAVPQHAELHWILSCDASVGALARMPTWKEKLAETQVGAPRLQDKNKSEEEAEVSSIVANISNPTSAERLKLGLFAYPILQAADILLYNTTHVPVGADQLVHIELTRSIAATFDHSYGKKEHPGRLIFTTPNALTTPTRRVMSLTEPNKKMSKSALNPRSRVLVTDSDEQIRKKLASALTDSEKGITYDVTQRPGIANLLEIIAALQGDEDRRTPGEIAVEFNNMKVTGSAMRVLKERAADLICKALMPVREEFERLTAGGNADHVIDEVAEQGRQVATAEAQRTMRRVREAVGLS